MQSSPKTQPLFPEVVFSDADERSVRTAGRVYQGLTIAAMLWLLVSLWAF